MLTRLGSCVVTLTRLLTRCLLWMLLGIRLWRRILLAMLSNAIGRLTGLLAMLRLLRILLMLLGILLLLLLRLRLLQKIGRALAVDEAGNVTGHGHFGGDLVKHLAQLGAGLAAEKAAAEAPKAARLRLRVGTRRLAVRSLRLLLLLLLIRTGTAVRTGSSRKVPRVLLALVVRCARIWAGPSMRRRLLILLLLMLLRLQMRLSRKNSRCLSHWALLIWTRSIRLLLLGRISRGRRRSMTLSASVLLGLEARGELCVSGLGRRRCADGRG